MTESAFSTVRAFSPLHRFCVAIGNILRWFINVAVEEETQRDGSRKEILPSDVRLHIEASEAFQHLSFPHEISLPRSPRN